MTLYWHSNSQRFTRSRSHVPDSREPSIEYEWIGCWNCAGDGDIEQSDGYGGSQSFPCFVCEGEGDILTSKEQFPQEDYFDDLRQLGLLTQLSSEWNLTG